MTAGRTSATAWAEIKLAPQVLSEESAPRL
jgi:hypothetical protein